MKSQIKRFSKSTLSVILSLCMLVSCMTVGIIATDAAPSAEERVGAKVDDENLGDTTYYMHIGVNSAFRTSDGIEFTYDSTNSLYYASYELTANSEYPMVICTTSGSLGDGQKSSSNQSVITKATTWNPDSIQFDYFSYQSNNYDGYDCFKLKTQTTQTVYFTFTSTSSGLVVRSSLDGGGEGGGDDPEPSGDTTTDTVNQTSGKTIIISYDRGASSPRDYAHAWQKDSSGTQSDILNNSQMTAASTTLTQTTDKELMYVDLTNNLHSGSTYDVGWLAKYGSGWDSYKSADQSVAPGSQGYLYCYNSSDSNGSYDPLKLVSVEYPSDIYKNQAAAFTVAVDKGAPYFLNGKGTTTSLYKLSVGTSSGGTNVVNGQTCDYATKSFSFNWTPSASGSQTLYFTLTDGIDTVTYSKAYTVTLRACDSVSLAQTNPASGTIYEGKTAVTYTATATNAVTGVTYNFKVGGTSVQNTSSYTYTTTFASAGTKSVTVTVEKSGYGSVTSSAVDTVVSGVYLLGLKNEHDWDVADKNKMTYNASTGLYEITRNLYQASTTYGGSDQTNATDTGFKVYTNGDSTYYGSANGYTINGMSYNNTTLSSGGHNVCLTTKDLSGVTSSTVPYKFTFDISNKKVTVYYPMKVTYNMQSHGTNPSANGYVVAYGSTINAPTAPTEAGYTFGGWYKESSCTNAWDFSTDTVTADTVLYAKWTQNEYTISYPSTTTGYTLDGSKPTSAHYGETISFTVTPLTGYRIKSVKYNDGSDHPLTGSNNSYSFSMPDNNVTVSVETVQTYTVTFSKGTGVGNVTYEINGGGSTPYSAPFTVDNNSTVVFTVAYNNGYEYNSVTDATASNNGKTLTVSSITSDKNVSLTAKKSTYNLVGACSPTQGGTVTFYKTYANAVEGTNPITTAQMDDEVYAKYTAASDYYTINTSNRFSKSGAGLSDLTLQENTNIVKFTMGYAQATITANVIAATPTFGACPDMDAYIGESFTYTVANLATLPNSTLSYTFNNETNNTGTFTPPAEEGAYTLTITASNKPDGISTAATATKNVTITVKYHEKSVTYYVDMHNNNMDGKDVEVAVVTNGGGTTLMKANSFGKLSQQSSSTVYSKAINTPATKSNSTTYNAINLRIRYGTEQAYNERTIYIDSDDATALMNASSPEVWIEAQNEEGNTFKVTYASNTTTAVASGKKRIYVAKPFAWQDNDASWKHIHLYHWGNYTDIGWNSAPLMNHIGYDSEYHYYYVDVDSSVSNIIFQGWKDGSTTPDAQTGNIENIGSSNFFVLSKDGDSYSGTKGDNATVPGYTRYVSRVDMNIGETANITPTYTTGATVKYICDSNHISITEDGVITANSSTYGGNDIEITVKVYGSVGAKATSANPGDYMTYTCKVSVRNPGALNKYKIMSFAHQEYTVKIDNISGTQPGYFDLSKTSAMVNGLYNGSTYTLSYANSAIIVSSKTVDDSVVGTVTTEFTVKYAASNSSKGYSNITINNATIVTKSIKHQGEKRYGFKEWDPVQSVATKTAVIEDGVETVTHKGFVFSSGTLIYKAVFDEYDYVDVTFTFTYWEYNPQKVDVNETPLDDSDDMINYFYDASWAGNEDSTNANFSSSHTQKTYTVNNFEVRGKTANGADNAITEADLANAAATAIGVMPSNNYYTYTISSSNITKSKTGTYTVSATVNMTQNVRHYSVYLNGEVFGTANSFTYQQYAEISGQSSNSLWYAVDKTATSINEATDPLLATGSSYKFRVKGDTYLRTKTGDTPEGNDFNRSEVDFSHYEVQHRDNPQHELVDYLLQNFYIADFFSPANVLDPQSYTGKGKFGVAYKVEEVTAPTTASSGDITVYFTDSLDWNNICIYYWGENINNINWPGLAMTQSGIDADNKKIYSAVIPGTAEGVIFTGNNNQTVDITNNISNGSHWKSINETVRNGIPYDDAQFVGGGVVYYSMNGVTDNSQGTPFANAVSAGYVDGSTGKINENAVKEMLKTNIEAQYAKDSIAGTAGEETAMKVAYGTEIAAKKNVEGGFNTGIIYRYLPLNQYKRNAQGVLLNPDENGNYAYDVNKNTFRYSNTLHSYQYVYASGNENKETNAGKNMRLYSYYVYSYVAYNQETNVPETKYEIVLSDNYSDASTYWNGK